MFYLHVDTSVIWRPAESRPGTFCNMEHVHMHSVYIPYKVNIPTFSTLFSLLRSLALFFGGGGALFYITFR